jgi:hypothetical protein
MGTDEIDLHKLTCSELVARMRELRNSSDGTVSLTESVNYGRAHLLLNEQK